MAFFRARDPVRSTPNLDRHARRTVSGGVLRLALLIGVPLAAMLYYGQPGLRMQYWYHGDRAAPIYTRCQYMTILGAWHDIRPPVGIDMCPLIGFFPFQLSDLAGG